MFKKPNSRSSMLLGAIIGGALGLLCCLLDGLNQWHPVTMCAVSKADRQDSTLHVTILGIWKYERQAAHAEAFRTEMKILYFVPLILLILFSTVAGAMVFRFMDRLVRGQFRQPETIQS